MAFDIGAHFADLAPSAQASTPVTDLSPHVDGGQGGVKATGSNANAASDQTMALYVGIGIVLSALVMLWLMGAVAFRTARL